MSNESGTGSGGKRPYEKPTVSTISLQADEVLAVGCKMASAGPGRNPGSCKIPFSCASVGS